MGRVFHHQTYGNAKGWKNPICSFSAFGASESAPTRLLPRSPETERPLGRGGRIAQVISGFTYKILSRSSDPDHTLTRVVLALSPISDSQIARAVIILDTGQTGEARAMNRFVALMLAAVVTITIVGAVGYFMPMH
jgi:hypothetical protein